MTNPNIQEASSLNGLRLDHLVFKQDKTLKILTLWDDLNYVWYGLGESEFTHTDLAKTLRVAIEEIAYASVISKSGLSLAVIRDIGKFIPNFHPTLQGENLTHQILIRTLINADKDPSLVITSQ